MEVQRLKGLDATKLVNPFYEKFGQHTRARPEDLFFVIFERKTLIASVRYCLEEGTHLLRGMMVDEKFRRKGVGTLLLNAFEDFLRERNLTPTYCVPHSYLEPLYSKIGFKRISSGPSFLIERVKQYNSDGKRNVILMCRTTN